MHPYALIHLVACLASAGLASAIVAREPTVRSSRIMATMLACAGGWALLDLLASASAEREDALFFLRAVAFGYLPLGPLSLDLLLEFRAELRPRYRRALAASYGLVPIFALLTFATDWFVIDAQRIAWGWVPVYDARFLLPLFVTVVSPLLAFFSLMRMRGRLDATHGATRGRFVGLSLGAPVVVVVVSDLLLPMVDPNGPRIGSLSVALVAGGLWLHSLRSDSAIPATGTMAREILDRMTDGVALLARDGSFRAMNRSLAQLLQVRRDDLASQRFDLYFSESVEDMQRGLDQHETSVRTRSGERIPASISTSVISDRRGSDLGYAVLVKDQRGVVELRRRLLTSGRLAAVGELAAGIAHEVNNPIAFIQANLNLLSQHLQAIEKGAAASRGKARVASELESSRLTIDESLAEVERVASVVREVRGFSHSGLGLGMHDVNALLDSAVHLAILHRRDIVEVHRDFGELPMVECAGQDVKQVFLSVLLNATKGPSRAPSLFLRTRADEHFVYLTIEDPLWSVEPRLVGRDFDPALDDDLDSGGLGLSLSYQLVRQMGGDLRVHSQLGEGTAVQIRLPLEGATSASAPPQGAESVHPREELS